MAFCPKTVISGPPPLLKGEPSADEVAQLLARDEQALLTVLGVAEVVDHLVRLVGADEETHIPAADPERTYRDDILPAKLRLDAAYLGRRSARLDLWILAQTPRAILRRTVRLPATLSAEIERPMAGGAAERVDA